MRQLFHPALIDPAGSDPGAWIDLPDEGRAVLLDLPDLTGIATRKLLRVAHAVVTHTHMDHFIGFDHWLRVALRSPEIMSITGPEGFRRRVQGRISAYTWNLIESYPIRLRVQEIDGSMLHADEYSGPSRMEPVPAPSMDSGSSLHVVHAERAFRVETETFDHGIPVLGVAVREARRLSIDKDALERRGLSAGPWLSALKDALRRGASRDEAVKVPHGQGDIVEERIGPLADDIVTQGPGQVVAYLTDLAGSQDNLDKAARFVAGADLLLCEATFLHAERELAASRKHLTARQAGELARRAGVHRLEVFHISPRYEGRQAEIVREAEEAFGAPLGP